MLENLFCLISLDRSIPRAYLWVQNLTTRKKRLGDNDWEFKFVNQIPEHYSRYSFGSVGSYYAIDYHELNDVFNRGLCYAITCVDRHTIQALKMDFNTLVFYTFRPMTDHEIETILVQRGTSKTCDADMRRNEISSIPSEYFNKIEFYNHVLLNIGTKKLINRSIVQNSVVIWYV